MPIYRKKEGSIVINKAAISQVVKFLCVGVLNTAIAYLTYALFVAVGVHYIIANVLAFLFSITNAYFCSNRYVFKNTGQESRPFWSTFLKTALAYSLTGIFLNSVLLILYIEHCGLSSYLAQFFCLLITTPINFILNKFWAFKSHKP